MEGEIQRGGKGTIAIHFEGAERKRIKRFSGLKEFAWHRVVKENLLEMYIPWGWGVWERGCSSGPTHSRVNW